MIPVSIPLARSQDRQGSLVVVGSGISIGHLSAETRGWIASADKVLYCVADAPTERVILQLNQNCESLYRFYGEGKNRSETYKQMMERILECIRLGQSVCAAFYGHPGIFVNPGHRAIAAARAEGFPARMLPAVSSLDCMFCDVGFDPSEGCAMYEATDLLIRQRPIDTCLHIVVWQVGCVGDLGFSFNGFNGRHADKLIRYLRKFYPDDHETVVYEASQYSVCEPVLKRVQIQDLEKTRLSGIDTLYIPPRKLAALHLSTLNDLDLTGIVLKGAKLEPIDEIELSPAALGDARPN